ncbi:hypothetical protein [Sciscionella marina]|uniref:hypothetical protein n=1 Tax=Sciscionella marina TaxID=508770 RepID=UPI0004775312|nr:hypothetical protein [Sciscionella marina]
MKSKLGGLGDKLTGHASSVGSAHPGGGAFGVVGEALSGKLGGVLSSVEKGIGNIANSAHGAGGKVGKTAESMRHNEHTNKGLFDSLDSRGGSRGLPPIRTSGRGNRYDPGPQQPGPGSRPPRPTATNPSSAPNSPVGSPPSSPVPPGRPSTPVGGPHPPGQPPNQMGGWGGMQNRPPRPASAPPAYTGPPPGGRPPNTTPVTGPYPPNSGLVNGTISDGAHAHVIGGDQKPNKKPKKPLPPGVAPPGPYTATGGHMLSGDISQQHQSLGNNRWNLPYGQGISGGSQAYGPLPQNGVYQYPQPTIDYPNGTSLQKPGVSTMLPPGVPSSHVPSMGQQSLNDAVNNNQFTPGGGGSKWNGVAQVPEYERPLGSPYPNYTGQQLHFEGYVNNGGVGTYYPNH